MVAAIYFGLIAAPIYVSESKFIVRLAEPPSTNAFGSLLQSTGITRSQDDTFSAQEFLDSRDALRRLEQQLPIRTIFSRPDADWFARFPYFWDTSSFEGLFRYYRARVEVVHNTVTGITTLRTTAFRPQDAYDMNFALLGFSNDLLNRLNERAREDAVRFSTGEVREAEGRLIEAQAAITAFRNKELTIDPARASTTVIELIARLSSELALTRSRRTEVSSSAPDSPAIPFMTNRILALEQQIDKERIKVVGGDSSMAPRIVAYEKLTLARDLADKALTSASNGLDSARADVRRQQLYLESIVTASLPDEAEQPYRLKSVFVVFLVSGTLLLLVWLLVAAVRDYSNS